MHVARLSLLGYECRKRRANPTSPAPPASSAAPMPTIGPVVLPVRGNWLGGGTVVGETPADVVVAPMVVEVVSGTVLDVVDVEVVVEVVVTSPSSQQNEMWLIWFSSPSPGVVRPVSP